MDAENLFSGNHDGKHDHRVQPSDQSFFYSLFLHEALFLILKNN
jgi:hypothetical protein